MSTPVLAGYATHYGSTQEVADAVTATQQERGLAVDIQPMREVRTVAGCSKIVLGAPFFMFRWHKDARHFLSRHRQVLMERALGVFALGPLHDPCDDEEWQDLCTQLDRGLSKSPWVTPDALEMFGDKYDPAKSRFPINSPVRNRQATCGTGQRSPLGQATRPRCCR